ncbi:MAG: acyl carrier protein [Acidimicrobiia bacterium]|nr:acyl carrier protein [Acidimicrobiia bacterium]
MTIEDKLRSFIMAELRFPGPAEELTDDFPLLEREVVDSLGIMRLVTFLEDDLDVEVDDEELVPDHFATIADIAKLVAGKS